MKEYRPCRVCDHYPHIPDPVYSGNHSHYQVICIHCGIEVTNLSEVSTRMIWNTLMRD